MDLVEVDITLYDVNNKIIGTSSTFTNPSTIQPFDSAAFKISVGPSDVSDVNAINNWKLTANYR